MSSELESFSIAAEEFCTWCESGRRSETAEAESAARHLSKLYNLALGLRLPDGVVDEDGADAVGDEEWKVVFNRCASLPFSYYSVVFDPHTLDSEEPVTGDLGDDIADMYRDIGRGLSLHQSGHSLEAEWQWCFSFRVHWGRHAVSALHALHCWRADNGGWQLPNTSIKPTR